MPLEVIPKTLENMNSSEKYVLNKLTELYKKEEQKAILYLEPKIKNITPDFILIDPKYGVTIIEVKAWSLDYIKKINNKEVVLSNNRRDSNPSFKTRNYFNMIQNFLKFKNDLVDEKNELKFNLYANLFLTQISENESNSSGLDEYLNHYPATVSYKNDIQKINTKMLFYKGAKKVNEESINLIRSAIFPETEIKPLTDVENKNNETKIKVMDTNQEEFAKKIPNGHYHISGTPGSGKTVILIARAIHLLRENPDWRIAIVTYNRSLKSKIELKLKLLEEDLSLMDIDVSKIEVFTFHALALKIASIRVPYQATSEFWENTLPQKALEKAYPQFDAICIDEYQDFRDDWIKVCVASIRKYPYEALEKGQKVSKSLPNILFVGDRLQSIYNPNEINWSQTIGLDMRGRSKLLKTSYRTTSEHIFLALQLLETEDRYKDEIKKFYDGKTGIIGKNRLKNSIIFIDNNNELIEKLSELIEKYKKDEILILTSSKYKAELFIQQLPHSLRKEILFQKEIVEENKITITTYHSSKGLEAKVVIILNVNDIADKKLAYVAMTRASQRLLIHSNSFHTGLAQEIQNLYSNIGDGNSF
jgi:superfamily I DNA and RNA helicase